ncbi:HAD-IA family hydrolase [Ruminococcus sp. Marseille-P6503]|uniref:HAD family hydrolase n=1 Tax=Ruminococcus sp. Marseille-P6503 TaxID=2364796 RepID=UPI000F532C06|nr:HAD-IA family hydrolase [Ruminococcus sp. Marseille-P6503]
MGKYAAYVFDFDLTLADSSKGILICFKHTLNKFGYEIPDDDTIYRTIGLTLVDAFDVLTGIENNPQREEMRREYVRIADKEMVRNTFFYDDAIAILQALQHAGLKVGIVSTKYRYRIEDTFRKQAGSFPVDIVIGGEDVKSAKPDPSGLNMMIERLGESKENVLYIGDSYIDAQTAANSEVDFAGVTTGSTTAEDFEKYPHVCICKSLSGIFAEINNCK